MAMNTSPTNLITVMSWHKEAFSAVFRRENCIPRCFLVQTHLHQVEQRLDESSIFYRKQTLCETLAGNDVPLLTITSQPEGDDPMCVDDVFSEWHSSIVLVMRVYT